jgi:hypothetical protein
MILDSRAEFCDAVALNTGGAGSYLLGSQIDTGGDGINDVSNLYLVINVDTTATSGGSATGQFHLASDSTASIATDGSATYHFSTAAIPVATLVAGYYVCKVELPKGTYERYLGILQTTAVAAFTAGKINAFLTNDPYTVKAFPNATNDSISL